MAALVLVSLCAVLSGPSVTAAASSRANVQTSGALVGAGVGIAGTPAVCAEDTNNRDLFVKGTDNALWWSHYNNPNWSAWQSLGGVLTSSPAAAAASGSNRIDVFVRGTTGALWQRTTTDGGTTWSAWYSLGGVLPAGTGPAACSWGAGRLDVFVQGTTGALYHKWYTGTSWSGWENLGGVLTSSPAAAAAPSSAAWLAVMDVFVRGTDNGLWQKTFIDGWTSWSPWNSVGGISVTKIATSLNAYVPPVWYGAGLIPNPGNQAVTQGKDAVVEFSIVGADGTSPCGVANYYIDGQTAGGDWRVGKDVGYGCPAGTYGGAGELHLYPADTAKLSLGYHSFQIDYLGDNSYAQSQYQTQFLVISG
jgi:hypothetical protein